jgi:hypothetical protein
VQVAADWVPAVTAGITALAALGGQAIAGWIQGRNQERIEASQRRQQAAEVLAEVMATLRNLAIGLLRLAGHTQIAPTLRWVNRNPARALAFLGLPRTANTPNPITPRPWTPRYEDPHQPPTSRDGRLVRYSRAQDGRNLRPREMFSLRRHEGT